MTIKSSGPLTIAEIVAEFGSINTPILLSDYYRGGSLVPNALSNTNISTTGQLNISMFYGASNLIYIDYLIVGGGASGGGGVANSEGGGGGAGGGGGVNFGTVQISPGLQSAVINVGKGGAAVGGYALGNDGNKTTVLFDTLYLEATGGIHGNAAAGKWNYSSNAAGGLGGLPNNGNVNAGRGGNGWDDAGGFPGYAGTIWPINGTRYAGGGGGGGAWGGAGGLGGGGVGGGGAGTNGLGGGGGGGNQDSGTSGKGGDGVVIISYLSVNQIFKGGIVTTTGSGVNKRWYHKFTENGLFGLVAGTSYTETGWHTYTLPNNIDSFNVEFVAAGGGGASASMAGNPTGGGGGAGGWGNLTIPKVPGVDTLEVYIGKGGTGGVIQRRYTYNVLVIDNDGNGNPRLISFYVYKTNGIYTTDYGGMTYSNNWGVDLRVYSSTTPQIIVGSDTYTVNYLGIDVVKYTIGIGYPNGTYETMFLTNNYGVYDEVITLNGTGGDGEATLVRYNGITYSVAGGIGGGKPYANNNLLQSGGLGGSPDINTTANGIGSTGNSGSVSTATVGGSGGNSHYTDLTTVVTSGAGGTNTGSTNVTTYAGAPGNTGGGGGGGGGNTPLTKYGVGGKGGDGWAKLTY